MLLLNRITDNLVGNLLAAVEETALHRILVAAVGAIVPTVAHLAPWNAQRAVVTGEAGRGAGSWEKDDPKLIITLNSILGEIKTKSSDDFNQNIYFLELLAIKQTFVSLKHFNIFCLYLL